MRRERSVAIALIALAIILGVMAPRYFSLENVRDMFLVNMPILIVAIGTTLVILSGEIDISVGSAFAVCSVVTGVAAKAGVPTAWAGLAACAIGAALGLLNGGLVAYGQIPSIVVTLAAMVAFRDGLRWTTQGAWIADLPPTFQWLGTSQQLFPLLVASGAGLLIGAVAWAMRNVSGGRAVYATGSNAEAARLAGINTALVKLVVFTVGGALTGLGALLNSVRFNQIPSNTGLGLEMKVVAAVVVGGAVITGGRGTFTGTVLGVVLLGAIGPALTFLGVSPQWERALQGAIILTAVSIDAVRAHQGARPAQAALSGV
jgi:rhamnose transport system permease protein